jgi:TolB protein
MKFMRRSLFAIAVTASAVGCVDSYISAPKATSDDASGYIYFASNREAQNFELYRMPASGGTPVRLTFDAVDNDYEPVPSPDGRLVAWEREVAEAGTGVRSTEIWVMNADGSGPRVVVRNGASNVSPSWVPGDTALVFASDVGGDWDIYRVGLAGGAPTNLTHDPYADQSPRVSPDGRRIAFQSNRTLDFEIYTMAVDGSGVRNVSHSPSDDRFPTWSADGSQIFWTRYVDNFNLWRMNADGTNQQAVLASPFSDLAPSVSPDGSAIVFTSDRVRPSTIFLLPLAGGAPRQLTNLSGWVSASDQDPFWSR